MKFFVTAKLKDTASSAPPATFKKLWEDNVKHVEKQMKAGNIQELYYIPGWNKTVSIEEHKSADELLQHLGESPLASFIDFEVYPLADWAEARKVMAKRFKAAG